MIQVSPNACIMVVHEPISFACRLKGMLALCRDILQIEPMDGGYFVFRNRSRTMLRVVCYDGEGFWLCEKILSKGTFRHWFSDAENSTSQITARELAVLLWNGDSAAANFPSFWHKLS